jgi:hypothetical protein
MHFSIPKTLSSRPWLLVVLLFGSFVAFWVFFINLAIKNQPQTVPLAPVPGVVTRHAQH